MIGVFRSGVSPVFHLPRPWANRREVVLKSTLEIEHLVVIKIVVLRLMRGKESKKISNIVIYLIT